MSDKVVGHIGHRAPVDNGGEPPDDGRMLERIEKLEQATEKMVERLMSIERDVAVVRSNYSTKADVHEAINSQTWKLVQFVCGFGTALVAITYFLAKHT